MHADRALLQAQIDPNGAETMVRFEYVDDAEFLSSGWTNATTTSPEVGVGMSKEYQSVSTFVTGLTPGTIYHYRAIGTNEAGSGTAAATFDTFAFTPSLSDACPNAHVRQQTGAALLLDCRAYELVSAANAGGYDVESNLVAGQTPFPGYPEAQSSSGEPQVLYGVHDGGIPGTGDPTNHGVDPYVATRAENGWTHEIRRHPRQRPLRQRPLRLDPAGSRRGPQHFRLWRRQKSARPALARPDQTGDPIHLPNGELVQGMAGSIPQPEAKPEGFIGKTSPPTANTSSLAPNPSSSPKETTTVTICRSMTET